MAVLFTQNSMLGNRAPPSMTNVSRALPVMMAHKLVVSIVLKLNQTKSNSVIPIQLSNTYYLVHTQTHEHARAHAHTHTDTHMLTHTYTLTHTNAHTPTHTRTYKPPNLQGLVLGSAHLSLSLPLSLSLSFLFSLFSLFFCNKTMRWVYIHMKKKDSQQLSDFFFFSRPDCSVFPTRFKCFK